MLLPFAIKKIALMFIAAVFLLSPLAASAAISLDFQGGNKVVLCPCESADASFIVGGRLGQEVFMQVEPQEGEIEVRSPASLSTNSLSRMRFKASCSAELGRKLFEVRSSTLDGMETSSQIFSVDVIACHSMQLRPGRREAQCPDTAVYSFELENDGKYSEQGGFSSNADFGYQSFSPKQFVLEPGKKVSGSFSVRLPPDLAFAPRKQVVEIVAETEQARAKQVVALVTPLCPGATPSPQIVVVQAAFPALPPSSFAEIEKIFANFNFDLTGFSVAVSSTYLYALLILMALLALMFYAVSKENELEAQRERDEKRRKARGRG